MANKTIGDIPITATDLTGTVFYEIQQDGTSKKLPQSIMDAHFLGQLIKAKVNFNGTGTIAIREQYNVSSITDGGAGKYKINFTTPLPTANYSVVVTCSKTTGEAFSRTASVVSDGQYDVDGFDIEVRDDGATLVDAVIVNVVVI